MMGIFTRLFRRRSLDEDVREEIESHIAMQTDLYRRSGMSPDEALQAARRRFGNVTAVRERLHDFYGFGWVETFVRDVAYAVRGLGRNPAVSLTAALTTAIGVGAVASMFSVLQTLLLAPPPHVERADRVFRVHTLLPAARAGEEPVPFMRTSYPFYERLADHADSLESVAAYAETDLAAGAGPAAAMARVVMVSAGFWRTLGVGPALGRFILDGEAHPATGARVVVLGHAFWQRRFDGRPDVLGETLRIKGRPYEIVGVTPRGFRGVELFDVDLWLPLFADEDGSGRAVNWHTFGSSVNLTVVGRLRPDVTGAQASAQLTGLQRGFLEETYGPMLQADAARNERYRQARVLLGPVTGGLGSDLRPIPEARVTAWLVGVAVVLVAIACLNVAGLLLLRAMRRRHEIAIRLALGISRWRLARLLLTESLVLALLGGAAAFAALILSRAWLQRTILPAMAWEPAAIVSPGVLAVAAAATLVTAFAAGISPLWYVVHDALPAVQGRILDAPGRRPRLQGGLLAAQGALSVILLVGAGLFLRSLHNATTLDIGLDRDNVLAVRVDFTGTGRSPDAVARFYESALDSVAAIPGIARASLAMNLPLRIASGGAFRLPGSDEVLTMPSGSVPFANYVTPGFFETTGMRMREGRGFLEAERAQGQVMVVNETLARLAWPDRPAVGECVYRFEQEACTTVVGVVTDARRFRLVGEEPHPYFYEVLPSDDTGRRALLVRMAPGQSRLDVTLRREISALDAGVPFVRIETLGEALDPQIRPWRLGASLFTAFGLLAVLLAAIGLWSSVSYAVSRRRHEFAVRLAVGSSRGGLVGLVLTDGLRTALIASAAGLLIAAGATPLIADLLLDTSPRDPAVFAVVAAGVLAVATLASLWPALRASRVNPAEALRAE